MIGKKINQLATELAPTTTDLTIIGDPISGVSKKITLEQLGAIFGGAVSFYTTLGDFPATGVIDIIYCAKDTKKLYLWSGSAYVEVFPSQSLLDTYQLRSEKGVSNGYASLDVNGKVPIGQLPNSIMEYKGTWSAATNTPTLANGTGDTGDVYICNAAGSVNFGAGAISFAVGDYVVYSGTIWQRSSGAVGTVTSVGITESGDALTITGSPITTSGTINIGFAGTGTQYIKGDGTLATFPSIISQAQNLVTEVYNSTGATLTKGTIVYINGGQGNLPTVTKALATGDSTSAQTYGVVQNDITNMNNGYVVAAGRLSDLDTQAYTNGTQLYLSSTTAGTWTSTKQYAPNHLVYVGIVVRAHPTQGIVEIKIQNGYEMDELHNVAAQSPSNNDGLFWEASTSLWKNKSIATVLGYTPANAATYVPYTGATTSLNLGANNITGQNFYNDGNGTNQGGFYGFKQYSATSSGQQGYTSIYALSQNSFYITFSQTNGTNKTVELSSAILGTTPIQLLFPNASGTLALTSQLTGGTVTSVGLSSATSGVTIGSTPITTSGTITLAIATASGSQQGLLSSTDWTTFNNKQNALTNPVTGTGTTNYLPKFTGTSTIGNSAITDDGSNTTSLQNFTVAKSNAILGINATNTGGFSVLKIQSSTIPDLWFGRESSTSSLFGLTASASVIYSEGAYPFLLHLNGATRLTMSTSGNLGLGVTPSAWNSAFGSVLQFKSAGSNGGGALTGSGGSNFRMFANTFYDGSYKYIVNGTATQYEQDGYHAWYTAPSGTAGNAISFTQAMTLDANGSLLLGATSPVGSRNEFRLGGNASGSAITMGRSGVNKALIQLDSGDNLYFENTANASTIFTTNNLVRLTIASTGAATFSSRVNVNGAPDDADIAMTIKAPSGAGKWILFGRDSSDIARFQVSSAGAATFSSSVTATELYLSTSNGLIGNINSSNANGGYITWQTSGTTIADIGTAQQIFGSGGNGVFGINARGSRDLAFGTNNTERVRITSGGPVGIGTTSPLSGYKLTLVGSGGSIAALANGSGDANFYSSSTTIGYHIYGESSTAKFYVVNGGQIYSTSTSISAISDIRHKENIRTIETGLNEILALKPSRFDWKKGKGTSKKNVAGFIAQDIETILPDLVDEWKEQMNSKESFKSIRMTDLIPTLVKAIQELKAELDTLKNK